MMVSPLMQVGSLVNKRSRYDSCKRKKEKQYIKLHTFLSMNNYLLYTFTNKSKVIWSITYKHWITRQLVLTSRVVLGLHKWLFPNITRLMQYWHTNGLDFWKKCERVSSCRKYEAQIFRDKRKNRNTPIHSYYPACNCIK